MQSLELFRAEEIRGASLLYLIATDIYPNLTHYQAPALCAEGSLGMRVIFLGLYGSEATGVDVGRMLVWEGRPEGSRCWSLVLDSYEQSVVTLLNTVFRPLFQPCPLSKPARTPAAQHAYVCIPKCLWTVVCLQALQPHNYSLHHPHCCSVHRHLGIHT